uniref:Uncharacterized protein n=1 Tax=Leersia perrieri TaxID=77586 RepID=A0A0D9VZ93_9ORYZ
MGHDGVIPFQPNKNGPNHSAKSESSALSSPTKTGPVLTFSSSFLNRSKRADQRRRTKGVFLPCRRRHGEVGRAPGEIPGDEPVPVGKSSRCTSLPPQALASVDSLMLLHSAAARLRSCIAADSSCWSCLSQCEAPLYSVLSVASAECENEWLIAQKYCLLFSYLMLKFSALFVRELIWDET